MAQAKSGPPQLTVGPVLGLVAILLSSVLGLLLLASAWSVNGSSDALSQQLPPISIFGPIVALVAPAIAVLVVAVPVLLLRWTEPASERPWPKRAARGSASTADP